jgi:hypothetical protein
MDHDAIMASMIPKSGDRFSDKIMLEQKIAWTAATPSRPHAGSARSTMLAARSGVTAAAP